VGQPNCAWPFVAHELFNPGNRHRADRGIDGREEPTQADERNRAEQRSETGHGSS
jgi:hypothetical protein